MTIQCQVFKNAFEIIRTRCISSAIIAIKIIIEKFQRESQRRSRYTIHSTYLNQNEYTVSKFKLFGLGLKTGRCLEIGIA